MLFAVPIAGYEKKMRGKIRGHLLLALFVAWPLATRAAVDMRGRTYLSVEGPVGKASHPGTPVLKGITAQYGVIMKNGMRVDVMPEFHFAAPKGNAVRLHREMVESDSAIPAAAIRSAAVAIPAAQQVTGATIKGGWFCGPGRYHVTLRAWLEDADGNSGNALQYTIHCNELVMF